MLLKQSVLIRKPHESLGVVSLFNEPELLMTLQLHHWGEKDPKTLVWITLMQSPMLIELHPPKYSMRNELHLRHTCQIVADCCILWNSCCCEGLFWELFRNLPAASWTKLPYLVCWLACCRPLIEQYCWWKLSAFQSYGLPQRRYRAQIRGIGAHSLRYGNRHEYLKWAFTALRHHIELLICRSLHIQFHIFRNLNYSGIFSN